MKNLSKKFLSILMAAAMVVTMIPAFAITASAAIKWTPIASSDFSTVNSVSQDAAITPSTYNGMGNQMTWTAHDYGNALSVSNGAVYIPDGYMYLSGYSGGCVPITGYGSKWKIDFGFRFKTTNSGDDKYFSDGDNRYSFMKMYVYSSDLANVNQKNAAYCYFSQNANGVCYSWEDDGHNVGLKSRNTSVTTGNSNLTTGTDYHYIAEFDGTTFKAYITDNSGREVTHIVTTTEPTFISRLNNISWARINAFKIGDDDNNMYFKGLEYRNITFYTDGTTNTSGMSAVDTLAAKMADYEAIMSSGQVFKNMSAAYTAYVNANKAYDAYVYGNDTSVNIATYASNLQTAIDNMEPWNGYKGTFAPSQGTFNNDSEDAAYYYGHYNNLLYLPTGQSSHSDNHDQNYTSYWISTPGRVVALYDGVNVAKYPAMPIVHSNGSKKPRGASCFYIGDNNQSNNESNRTTTNNYIYLDDYWHWGGQTDYNFTASEKNQSMDIPYYYSTTTNSSICNNNNAHLTGHICIKNDNISFSNGYSFTLSGTVYFVGRNFDSALHTYTSQNLNYITMVNYKPVYDAINSSTNKAKLADVANYKQGGLSSLMAAYQAAQNFDPNSYDYSSSIPAQYNTDMQEVVSAFTSASTTTDNAAYATMRSYLTNGLNTKSLGALGSNLTAKYIYENAGINNTNVANYDRFAAAYADAVNHMAALPTSGYGHTATSTGRTAAQINAELSTAYNLLERKGAAATPTIGQLSGQNYLGIGDTISVASSEGSIEGTVTYKIYYDVDNTAGAANTTATFAYGSSANVNIFPDSSHNKAIVTAKGNDAADGAATETVERTFYRINSPSFTGYYNPTLVAIPANGIVDKDAIVQAQKSATNDDASITLQYSYNGGESWNDDISSGQIDALYHDGAYASVSTVTIRSVVKSGGNVVAHSENASVSLARQADFGIYVESAGSTAKFYDAGNTGADTIIIYDTENYSDDIVFTLQANGVAVSGTGEDVAGVFTYDKTNGINLAGNSKAAEAIKNADYVTIKAYSRDVKSGNYDTYETATFYNEGKFDKLLYHESFNGTANGSTYATNDSRGINITKGDYNSAGTSINVVANAGDRNGFAKSESGTSADMRKNALKISGTDTNNSKEAYAKLASNPFANDLTKTFVKENGVTISFWRAVESTGTTNKENIDSGTLKRNAIAFRKTSAGTEGGNIYGYYMIECTGNMSYTKTQTDYFDIVPGEYDVTQNSLSKYSGYWQHVAVTINPKAATVEEAVTVYIDGVPHPASTSYSQNYDISTSIAASGGEYAAATDTVSKTIGDLLDMICDSGTYICLGHDNLWQSKTNDVYLDDIRFYAEPLTQKEIWETYYDEISDTPTLEGNRASVTHDPTTISVYKLKSASNGMAAGSLVGQEFIDYYNVPSSNYTVEYYSYGTGLQIYHSTDNVNWEIVGDSQGRVAYQSHDQFVKDNGNGTWSSLEYHTALSEVLTSIRNASDYNNSQKGAGHLVWAPHVSYNLTTNKWMMYVAISCWSGATSAIISMESADGTPVHFVARDSSNNQAYSVIVKSSGRPNAIDACTYYKYNNNGTIDPSTLYMAYGAWSQGEAKTEDLCTMQLNANGTAKYGASGIITYSGAMSAEDGTRICASQPSEPDGVTGEGAFITYHNGYYYLYVAYGVNDYNYVTRVFRSTSPTGPFVDYNGVEATNSSAVHGTQIMAPHYVTGDNYIYMSTGHDSIYKAVNNNGEVITIHSAHARPVSNEANSYKELPDFAMVTRQIALAGSVTITHAMFYTQSGWAISMPEQFNGTDTSHAITATQLDGLYKASTLHDIIDEGLTYSSKAKPSGYSTNWDFSKYVYFAANDATTGVIYGAGDTFLTLDLTYELSYDTGDPATSTTTYITIKNGDSTVAEGVVAMHDGKPELSYFNIEQGDFGGGVDTRASSTVWSVKVGDLPSAANFNAIDSAYAEGDALLKSLAGGSTAQYSKTSVDALITAVNAAKADVSVSTAKKKLVAASNQSTLNSKADAITTAIAGLTPISAAAPAEDFSTYEAAVSAINNLDPDAYEENSGGSIASAKSTANSLVSGSTTSYTNESTYTINVVDGTADQENVDLAVDRILDALSTCTKKYDITADSGVTSIGSKNGTYEDGKATYGTTMTFRAASEDTAWNLEVTSRTSYKKPAFYGYGKQITVKVTGALDVTTETRSGEQKRVKFIRHYSDSTNEKPPIQKVEYVSAGDYTLPNAANTPAFANYTFDKYYVNGTPYDAGATVNIAADTDIIAMYNYDSTASYAINATALSGGTNVSGSYGYNARIELNGGTNAYGWSVDLGGGNYRPFCVGANAVYFADETLTLVAENEATFKAHGYSLPNVYLNGGVIDVGGKKVFNAQVVADNMDNVKESGILVAVANGKQPGGAAATAVVPEDYQVTVENSGQQMGYAILRAKSTKFVGANQIAIAVNSLPEGYIYRGYVIYDNNGALETVYTDVVR
jgi:hypothetical protein